MASLTSTERAVLKLAAEEVASLEQLYWSFRNSQSATPLADTADAVESLVRRGLLMAKEGAAEPLPIWRAGFAATPSGREALAEENAPNSPVTPADQRRPSLFGAWNDLAIRVTREDIDEVRREMWANFPRDQPK